MRKIRYIAAAILVSVLLLSLTAVSAFAATPAEFTSAVAALDPTAAYPTRVAAAEAARTLYGQLNATEQASVSDDYAALEAEETALEQIRQTAEDFFAILEELSDAADVLSAQAIAARAVEAGENVDPTYPGAADAIARADSEKQRTDAAVADSVAYIEAVEAAAVPDITYTEMMAALARADACTAVDPTYPGVAGARTTYRTLRANVYDAEQSSIAYLGYIAQMESATTYGEIKRYYDYAAGIFEDVIEDYPGIEDCAEKVIAAKARMNALYRQGNAFVAAVSALSTAENEAQQIRLCYQLLEEVDLTVPDTAAARTTLEAAKTEYETRIAICNGEMDRLTEAALVCGYGVGDTASAASAALPTALPPRSKEI